MKRHVMGTLAMVAALALSPGAIAAPPHRIFKADPNWPKQLPHGYVFGASGGVAVDSHDNVWVYSRPGQIKESLNDPPDELNGIPAPAVVELSPDGRFLQGWGGPLAMSDAERAGFDWPVQEHGIAVDSKGNVWSAATAMMPRRAGMMTSA
jgi:hypothetical protein